MSSRQRVSVGKSFTDRIDRYQRLHGLDEGSTPVVREEQKRRARVDDSVGDAGVRRVGWWDPGQQRNSANLAARTNPNPQISATEENLRLSLGAWRTVMSRMSVS